MVPDAFVNLLLSIWACHCAIASLYNARVCLAKDSEQNCWSAAQFLRPAVAGLVDVGRVMEMARDEVVEVAPELAAKSVPNRNC